MPKVGLMFAEPVTLLVPTTVPPHTRVQIDWTGLPGLPQATACAVLCVAMEDDRFIEIELLPGETESAACADIALAACAP